MTCSVTLNKSKIKFHNRIISLFHNADVISYVQHSREIPFDSFIYILKITAFVRMVRCLPFFLSKISRFHHKGGFCANAIYVNQIK
jgi:hypothetical protein